MVGDVGAVLGDEGAVVSDEGAVVSAVAGDVIGTAGGEELRAQEGGLVPEEAFEPDVHDTNRQACFRRSSRCRGPGGQPSVSG